MAQENKANKQIEDFLLNLNARPKCIVFDLDFTLWPFNVDSHLLPPFKKSDSDGLIYDHNKKQIKLFDDIKAIFEILNHLNVREKKCARRIFLAVASRSTTPNLSIQLIEMLDLKPFFSSIQIYPGAKTNHLKKIQSELRLSNMNEILFYDDDRSNIQKAASVGAVACQVRRSNGLTREDFLRGLEKYSSTKE